MVRNSPSGSGIAEACASGAFFLQLVPLVREERKRKALSAQLEEVQTELAHMTEASTAIGHRIRVNNKRQRVYGCAKATDGSGGLYLDKQCDRKHDLEQQVQNLTTTNKTSTLRLYELAPGFLNDELRPRLPPFPPDFYRQLRTNISRHESIEPKKAQSRLYMQDIQDLQVEIVNVATHTRTLLDDGPGAEPGGEPIVRATAEHLAGLLRRTRDLTHRSDLLEADLSILNQLQDDSESALLLDYALPVLQFFDFIDASSDDDPIDPEHRTAMREAYNRAAEDVEQRHNIVQTVSFGYRDFVAATKAQNQVASKTEIDHLWYQHVAEHTRECAAAWERYHELVRPAKAFGVLSQTSGFGDVEGDGAVDTEASGLQRQRLASTNHVRVWNWVCSPDQCRGQGNSLCDRWSRPKDECDWQPRPVDFQDIDRYSDPDPAPHDEDDRRKRLIRANNEQCERIRESLLVLDSGGEGCWGRICQRPKTLNVELDH